MAADIGNILPLIPADIDSAFNNDVDPALEKTLETAVKKRPGKGLKLKASSSSSTLAHNLAKAVQALKQRGFCKNLLDAYYALSKNADEASVDAALDAARRKLKIITDPLKRKLGTALVANIQSMVTIERVGREVTADEEATRGRIRELEKELVILKNSVDNQWVVKH